MTGTDETDSSFSQGIESGSSYYCRLEACVTNYEPVFRGEPAISRRKRKSLPHWEQESTIYFVTFRLADSLPKNALSELAAFRKQVIKGNIEIDEKSIERLDRYLDAGAGACWLRNPLVADVVEKSILHFNKERYIVFTFCIMPNHVHVVFSQIEPHSLTAVLHSWKSYTANQANRILGRKGAFWQIETYDRIIRDRNEFINTIEYVLNNPIAAGLKNWKWVYPEFVTEALNLYDLK